MSGAAVAPQPIPAEQLRARQRKRLMKRMKAASVPGAGSIAARQFLKEVFAAGQELHAGSITKGEFQRRMDASLLAAIDAIEQASENVARRGFGQSPDEGRARPESLR